MKLLLICGSARKKSRTLACLEHIKSIAKDHGDEVYLWNLMEETLPITMPEHHSDPSKTPNDNVKKFLQKIEWADSVVLGTPLYHGSYSGVLKGALDNLAFDEFRDKPVGLVSAGSGLQKSAQPNLHLVAVVQTLYGIPTQTQIGVHANDFIEQDDAFVLDSQAAKDRCERLLDEMRHLSAFTAFKKHRSRDNV